MRVGCVEYINAFPLIFPFTKYGKSVDLPTNLEFTFAIPSRLNALLQEKKLDVALTSSVEYLEGDYQLMPDFCIASREKILSVNLYTRIPLHELSGKSIGLTSHSKTSVALLKVLCHHFWQVTPHFVPLENPHENHDAFLLIGDPALQKMKFDGFETIDLAEAWYTNTHLPFVFAVFAAQKNVVTSPLHSFIEKTLAASHEHPDEIVHAAHLQSGLREEIISYYYSLFQFRLGKKELQGLKTFNQLRNDVSKICA